MMDVLLWLDVETTGINPETDQLLEAEARITSLTGDQLASWHVVVRHLHVRCDTPKVNDMHSRNGLISECGTPGEGNVTLGEAGRSLRLFLTQSIRQGWRLHPAGTNVQFDMDFITRNFGRNMFRDVSHRRLDLTTFRLARLAHGIDVWESEQHDTTHRTGDCLDRDIREYQTILPLFA